MVTKQEQKAKEEQKKDLRSPRDEKPEKPIDLSAEQTTENPQYPDQGMGMSMSERQQETEKEEPQSRIRMTKELLLKIHEMLHEKGKFHPGDTITTEEGEVLTMEIDPKNCRFFQVDEVRWAEQDPKANSDFAREIALGFRITVGVKTGTRGLVRQNNNNAYLDLTDGVTNFLDEYRPQFKH